MRIARFFFVAIFIAAAWLSIRAQQQVVLGNPTVALTGPWKFSTGDNMAWAQPGFDDSGWGTMDLTPPRGSYDPIFGSGGYVPGWTARGYRGYHGYAWYRLRVNIQDGQTRLALKMPNNFDDAYQVYVNGQLAGQFGRFTARGVTAYIALPQAIPLPANVHGGPVTIVIRMWMAAFTPLVDEDAGGLHGPPVLGQVAAIAGLLQLDWDAIDRSLGGTFLVMAVLLLALMVAFGLFWLEPREQAYLWLGITCAAVLFSEVVQILCHYTPWISETSVALLQTAALVPAIIGLWVLFWAYWFRLDGMARLHRLVWGLELLLFAGTAMLRAPLYGGMVPVHAIGYLLPLTLVLKLLLGVLLVWVTYRGIRKDGAEGWLALPAVVLIILALYQRELLVLHVPINFFLFGFGIGLDQISIILSLSIITVLLLRRFLHAQREQEQLRQEMEQARQIQQVLIPRYPANVPGFTIESVYMPAQQVGGDFFHISPGDDGSLLVVAGDVSGKGLKAAMTVSEIVGALRGCTLRQPAAVLAYLNGVLHGQIGGFVTCCGARIAADGQMSIANAGHLSPYRNGEEMALQGGLPLGILADCSYEETECRLNPGDRLTILSDGVVEARNPNGELYGFERTQGISNGMALEIAESAKNFGQEDDITVLTIKFAGAAVPPALQEAVLAQRTNER